MPATIRSPRPPAPWRRRPAWHDHANSEMLPMWSPRPPGTSLRLGRVEFVSGRRRVYRSWPLISRPRPIGPRPFRAEISGAPPCRLSANRRVSAVSWDGRSDWSDPRLHRGVLRGRSPQPPPRGGARPHRLSRATPGCPGLHHRQPSRPTRHLEPRHRGAQPVKDGSAVRKRGLARLSSRRCALSADGVDTHSPPRTCSCPPVSLLRGCPGSGGT